MREIGRVQQGFFPTQDRIVRAIAGLLQIPVHHDGLFPVLDAGCGTGNAIHDLREIWLSRRPDLSVTLLGIESDKDQCQKAASLLVTGKGGGTALPPESPRLANVRLAVPGWSRHVHHVAMLDRSGDLMLAPDETTLWRKLLEKMSCPTLESWAGALMGAIHRSGMLLECESFGVSGELRAFVLAPDAQGTFDSLVVEHVRTAGIPRRSAA